MHYKVNLVTLPEKVLRKKSLEVKLPLSKDDETLAKKMIWHIDTSQTKNSEFQPGVGVAAVQYGILKRMFYINAEMKKDENSEPEILRDVFINPKVLATSEYKVALDTGEGCLSVRNEGEYIKKSEGYVYRKNRIVFEAYSYFEKKVKRYDLTGYHAIVAQHELDHLEGKLFIDHINHEEPFYAPDNARLIEQGEK